jgi:hypothetical protein
VRQTREGEAKKARGRNRGKGENREQSRAHEGWQCRQCTDGLFRGIEVADEGRHVKTTDIPDHGASVSIQGSLFLLV